MICDTLSGFRERGPKLVCRPGAFRRPGGMC